MERPAYWAINRIMLEGRVQRRLMLVLRTPPCQRINRGKRCFICGFDYHSRRIGNYNIISQFAFLQDTIYQNRIEHIDFLGSGSLLDQQQVDYSQVLGLMEKVGKIKSIKSIAIEGRVEYCYLDKLQQIKQRLNNIELEYGIGIECFSDSVRNKILKKNLRFKDYVDCVKSLAKIDIGVYTYILAGIPKLSLKESLKETTKSILKSVDIYQRHNCKGRIALYPVFIAAKSQLEKLYNCNKYTLISLYDIINILLGIEGRINVKKYHIFVGLDDEGISDNRYVGFNDGELSKLIEKFNYTQDFSLFKDRVSKCN